HISPMSSPWLRPLTVGSLRKTRGASDPRQDVLDYIEMCYNPKRKHAQNGMLSPVEFERQQKLRQQGV
ncbi:IS3 family transposase, partial [uncultured Jannaschia sp.]|uniref:IS3 family transposase n=1 Tax=uncultured Jannaschia sp. TaxID=293347 RepID=UPI00261D8F2A